MHDDIHPDSLTCASCEKRSCLTRLSPTRAPPLPPLLLPLLLKTAIDRRKGGLGTNESTIRRGRFLSFRKVVIEDHRSGLVRKSVKGVKRRRRRAGR